MKIDDQGLLRDDDGRIPACQRCGKRWEYEIGPGKAQHYARATCKACGYGWWLAKPGKRKNREAKHADLVHKYSRGYCELCGILADRVPPLESLEAHHVDEYQDGGDRDRSNIQIVCTACHKLIHWRRTYLKHLIPDGVKHVDREEHTAGNEIASELDSLEAGEARDGQADQGSNSTKRCGGELDGPHHLDDV